MFNSSTYKAYTLFFIIGTLGATRIPVVGWTPLKSLEQMGPFGVFITYQLLEFCNYRIRKHKDMSWSARVALRIKVRCPSPALRTKQRGGLSPVLVLSDPKETEGGIFRHVEGPRPSTYLALPP